MLVEKFVSVFKLDRPMSANAFDLSTAEKLKQAMAASVLKKKLGLIIISNHPRIYCSGGDLRNYAALKTKSQGVKINTTIRKILMSMAKAPLYVIAAIDGDCIGGGCELALACDWIMTSESARFSFKQSTLGLTPGWGGGSKLLKRVNPSTAFDWLTSGDWISAHHALKHGLSDEVVTSGTVTNRALQFIKNKMEMNPRLDPTLLGKIKWLINDEALSENKIFESLWHSKTHLNAMSEKLKAISERI